MAKYNEVMSRVAVTPEMRERVLSNVENARAAKINNKKKISRTIIRWFPLAAAACLVLIVGIGFGNVYKDNNESVGTSNDAATSQGLEDCASLDQLCEKVGFDVPDLSADIPFEVKQTVMYSALPGFRTMELTTHISNSIRALTKATMFPATTMTMRTPLKSAPAATAM